MPSVESNAPKGRVKGLFLSNDIDQIINTLEKIRGKEYPAKFINKLKKKNPDLYKKIDDLSKKTSFDLDEYKKTSDALDLALNGLPETPTIVSVSDNQFTNLADSSEEPAVTAPDLATKIIEKTLIAKTRKEFLDLNKDLEQFFTLEGNILKINFNGDKNAEKFVQIQDFLKEPEENKSMTIVKNGVYYNWDETKAPNSFYSGDYRMQIIDGDEIEIKNFVENKTIEESKVATEKSQSSPLSKAVRGIDEAITVEDDKKIDTAAAKKLLEEQAAIRDADTMKELELKVVKDFSEQIRGQNADLNKKITDLRIETEGWTGYGHAIEPSNLVASIGGGLDVITGGEGFKTKEQISVDLNSQFLTSQRHVENGISILLKTMRGSKKSGTAAMDLKSAWEQLQSSKNPDFYYFASSIDGKLFASTVLLGKEPTDEDKSKYLYDKGMEQLTNVGKAEAEPYFQAAIAQYPGSHYSIMSQAKAMTTGEKNYERFTQFGDIFLRLDQLALLPLGGIAGHLAKTTRLGAVSASLLSKYPQLSKVIPGVRMLKAGENAGRLTKLGLGFGNFVVEVGKFCTYVEIAEKVAGEKAAYGVGMLCFLTPGLVHGFEQIAGKSADQVIKEEGADGIKKLAAYASEQAGGPKALETAITEGLVQEAVKAGQVPNRLMIAGKVDDAMSAIGLKVESKAETAAENFGERVAGMSKDDLSRLDGAVEKMFADKAEGNMDKLIGLLSEGFEKIIAGFKGLSESVMKILVEFRTKWGEIQTYIRLNFESMKVGSVEQQLAFGKQIEELTKIFRSLPKNVRESLTPYMMRLQAFAIKLEKSATTFADGIGAKKSTDTVKSAAVAVFEKFQSELSKFSKASPQRLEEINSYTFSAASERLEVLHRNRAIYKAMILDRLEGGIDFDFKTLKLVTGDYNGQLKDLVRTAVSKEEKIAAAKALIAHTESQIKPIEARIIILEKAGLGRFEKFISDLEKFKTASPERLADIASEKTVASATERLSIARDNVQSYSRLLADLNVGKNPDFKNLVVTGDHGGQLKALVRSAVNPKEKIAAITAVIEHTQSQIKPLEARLATLTKLEAAGAEIFATFGQKLNEVGHAKLLESIGIEEIKSHFSLISRGITNGRGIMNNDVAIALSSPEGCSKIKQLLSQLSGVQEGSTLKEYQKAIRVLMTKTHPDRGAQGNEELFKIISSAYEFTKDESLFSAAYKKAA